MKKVYLFFGLMVALVATTMFTSCQKEADVTPVSHELEVAVQNATLSNAVMVEERGEQADAKLPASEVKNIQSMLKGASSNQYIIRYLDEKGVSQQLGTKKISLSDVELMNKYPNGGGEAGIVAVYWNNKRKVFAIWDPQVVRQIGDDKAIKIRSILEKYGK